MHIPHAQTQGGRIENLDAYVVTVPVAHVYLIQIYNNKD